MPQINNDRLTSSKTKTGINPRVSKRAKRTKDPGVKPLPQWLLEEAHNPAGVNLTYPQTTN